MSEEKFAVTSRYYTTERKKLTDKNGREIVYLKRRFLPRPGGYLMARHSIEQGDRVDLLAAKYLGDPEQYWRICDINGVMEPGSLVDEIGELVDIAVPNVQTGDDQ